MRLHEKMQFKLKNFIYDQGRKHISKQSTSETGLTTTPQNTSKVMGTLEEMDEYIGEKMKNLKLPKMKKGE